MVLDATYGDPATLPDRLCEALRVSASMDAATLSLFTDTPHRQLLCATSDAALRLERLQFGLGEGPCVTAAREGAQVIVGDLRHDLSAWPLFGPCAQEQLTDVGAIYAFPLFSDTGSTLGTADLLCHRPLAPDPDAVEAAALAVRAASGALMRTFRETVVEGSSDLPPWEPEDILDSYWGLTHIAVSATAGALGITDDEALARLRARAFGTGRSLPDVANDVIADPVGWEKDAR
nr:GAF and ANTAR domain-containing protein [Streptomyces sp. SID14478]